MISFFLFNIMFMVFVVLIDIWSKDVAPYEWFQIWPMTSTKPSKTHWKAILYYQSLSITIGRRKIGLPVLNLRFSLLKNYPKFTIRFNFKN